MKRDWMRKTPLLKKMAQLEQAFSKGESVVLDEHFWWKGEDGRLHIIKKDDQYILFHSGYEDRNTKVLFRYQTLYDALLTARRITRR